MNLTSLTPTHLARADQADADNRRRAGLQACTYALATDDPDTTARELLAALGLDQAPPAPPTCQECGGVIVATRPRIRRYCGKACGQIAAVRARSVAAAARREARRAG